MTATIVSKTDMLDVNAGSVIDYGTLTTFGVPVNGGTLYLSGLQQGGTLGPLTGSFVPASSGGALRHLPLTSAKADTGVPLTATAAGGAMGIARTAGTSLALVGEATNANAATDKCLFEFDLPDSYVAGQSIPLVVNAAITGTGTLTAASCTLTAAFYTEGNGIETPGTVSAAGTIVAAGGDLNFTITGTALTPAQRCALELTMLVTSSAGANTGRINKVAIQA